MYEDVIDEPYSKHNNSYSTTGILIHFYKCKMKISAQMKNIELAVKGIIYADSNCNIAFYKLE